MKRRIAAAALAPVTAVALVAGLTACGQSESNEHVGHADFGHVHGLAVDPGSGALNVATHVGLFRVESENHAVRVSKQASDLMGFTVVGPGRFLASGHPDESAKGPANLGLIESTDGGVTWNTISLSGAADFHGLQAAHGSVYGYNSTDGAFMVSSDRRNWEHRSITAIGAFVVSPSDAQVVLAVGRNGLQRSTDGGRSWSVVPGAPEVWVLTWGQDGQVWGAGRDGSVWQSPDGNTWQRRGQLDAPPQSLTSQGSTLFAALAGDEIVASTDGGATWTPKYLPPS